MTRILERLGYHADIAGNGVEAVEACARQDYDLVFMDIEMPEMNGYDATRVIRRHSGALPRIVGLSAHASDDARTRCLDAGMDAYLVKPLRTEQLVETITESAAATPA